MASVVAISYQVTLFSSTWVTVSGGEEDKSFLFATPVFYHFGNSWDSLTQQDHNVYSILYPNSVQQSPRRQRLILDDSYFVLRLRLIWDGRCRMKEI